MIGKYFVGHKSLADWDRVLFKPSEIAWSLLDKIKVIGKFLISGVLWVTSKKFLGPENTQCNGDYSK